MLPVMATLSITAAVKTKYEALTAANFPSAARPPVFFGSAAQTTALGAQQRPPYVVFTEKAHPLNILDFERNALHVVQLACEVFAASMADVDTIVACIRLNGGTVGQGLGFDYGTLADLTAPRSTHQIVPTAEPRLLAPQFDKDGNRIHGCRLEFKVSVLELA